MHSSQHTGAQRAVKFNPHVPGTAEHAAYEASWDREPQNALERYGPMISGDLSPTDRRSWEALGEKRRNGWTLTIHEPWTDKGRARVVLTQSVFLVQFDYQTGDAHERDAARTLALQFADANPLSIQEVGTFRYFSIPTAVSFTAPLHAAGWVTGPAARQLNQLIEAKDGKTLDSVLFKLDNYTPRNLSQQVARLIDEHHNNAKAASNAGNRYLQGALTRLQDMQGAYTEEAPEHAQIQAAVDVLAGAMSLAAAKSRSKGDELKALLIECEQDPQLLEVIRPELSRITQLIAQREDQVRTASRYNDLAPDGHYVVDTASGDVVDGPYERLSHIPLRFMGYDGGHRVATGAELRAEPELARKGEDPFYLPAGWSESYRGGMATNPDPQRGGIIDKAALSSEWFVVFNRDGLDVVEGLASRQAAFETFAQRLQEADQAELDGPRPARP